MWSLGDFGATMLLYEVSVSVCAMELGVNYSKISEANQANLETSLEQSSRTYF